MCNYDAGDGSADSIGSSLCRGSAKGARCIVAEASARLGVSSLSIPSRIEGKVMTGRRRHLCATTKEVYHGSCSNKLSCQPAEAAGKYVCTRLRYKNFLIQDDIHTMSVMRAVDLKHGL